MEALIIDNDLFFTSRIAGVLKESGVAPIVSTNLDRISKAIESVKWIILNLSLDSPDPIALAENLKNNAPQIPILAYTEHTKTDLIAKARQAGCDVVVPNGALLSELKAHLAK